PRCGDSVPCVTEPSEPCEGPVPETIEKVSDTPDGAVPRSNSVAATFCVVSADESVAITVVGSAGGGSSPVGLIETTASPVAPAASRTRNVNESGAPDDAGVYVTFALDGDTCVIEDSEPADGPETMLNVSALPSASEPVSVIVSGEVPLVKTVCAFAAGA